jgi:hypothetical protein
MLTQQNEKAVEYLLDKLTDEERTAVEDGYFSDEAQFENMLAAETSLFDSYVSGDLSPEDLRLFEKRLLLTPRQRQRAGFAKTFHEYVHRTAFADLEARSSEGVWTAITSFFSSRSVLSYSLAAAIVLAAGIGAFLILSRTEALQNVAGTEEPIRYQTAPSRPAAIDDANISIAINSPPAETRAATKHPQTQQTATANNGRKTAPVPAIVSTIVLQFGATRSAGGGTTVSLPRNTTRVDLVLAFDDSEHKSYFAVVETAEGRQIWSGRVAVSGKNEDRRATVPVPSRRIKTGDYIVSLKGLSTTGLYEPVAEYSFTVTRPD